MQFDIEMKIIGNPFDVWQCLLFICLFCHFPARFRFQIDEGHKEDKKWNHLIKRRILS